MAFDDNAVFPFELKSLKASASWATAVTVVRSGAEQRIQLWTDSRRTYNAATGIKSLPDFQTIQKHFNGRRGQTRGFPLTDRSFDRVTDESFGTGDGATAAFQLTLNEGDSTNAYNREIYKPKTGTIVIKVAGTTKTEGTHYNIAYTTGIVTFTGGNIPTGGQALTWTGQFYVPVRYMVDELPDNSLVVFKSDATGLVECPDIPLIETRDIA